MAKLNVQTFTVPTDNDGETVSLQTEIRAGSLGTFGIIKPASYVAVVENVKEEVYAVGSGHLMWKITPQFRLLRDDEEFTIINRQDYAVGYVRDEESRELYSAKEGLFPIWSGARFLLQALGKFSQDGKKVDFDPNLRFIANQLLRVRTAIAVYTRNKAVSKQLRKFNNKDGNFNVLEADGFNLFANDAVDAATGGARKQWAWSETNEDLTIVIAALNAKYGVSGDEAFRTKNVIVYTSPLSETDIEIGDYYLDEETKSVYLTEADCDTYYAAIKAGSDSSESSNNAGW